MCKRSKVGGKMGGPLKHSWRALCTGKSIREPNNYLYFLAEIYFRLILHTNGETFWNVWKLFLNATNTDVRIRNSYFAIYQDQKPRVILVFAKMLWLNCFQIWLRIFYLIKIDFRCLCWQLEGTGSYYWGLETIRVSTNECVKIVPNWR